MGARSIAHFVSPLILGLLMAHATWGANLTVQVRERGNGRAIEGAAVCLGTGADRTQFGAVRTDSDGNASFEDILDAPLVLTVSKSEFRGERRHLEGIHFDTILTVLLPRGGLGPKCDAPVAAGGRGKVLRLARFRIDGGAAQTRQRRVELNFAADGAATDYRVSEAQDFADAQWQPMKPNPTYTLSARPGRKQLFLQLRKYHNTEGLTLETRSNVVSDTIDLRP